MPYRHRERHTGTTPHSHTPRYRDEDREFGGRRPSPRREAPGRDLELDEDLFGYDDEDDEVLDDSSEETVDEDGRDLR